jgi:hypothetical protein
MVPPEVAAMAEALIVAFVLAVVPYALVRGLASWIARSWSGRAGSLPLRVGRGA